MTNIDALHIATNPRDLVISFGELRNEDGFGFIITFGESRNFRPIINTNRPIEKIETVKEMILSVLKTAQSAAKKILEESGDSIIATVCNPGDTPYDESLGLLGSDIEKIEVALREGESPIYTEKLLALETTV